MIKRAAIYIRVSSESQVDNFSLRTQQSTCDQYATDYGFSVLATFSDEKSGATLDRPGLTQLRALVAAGTLDAVIVYAIDRLTRTYAHALLLQDEMQRAGVELHIVSRHEHLDAATGATKVDMLDTTFAEYEHQSLQERFARGRRGKNEAGSVTGQGGFAPYGYHMEGKKHTTHLVVDEPTAAIVRLIFALFLDSSVRETRRRLQALGVPSPVERGGYPQSIYKRRAKTEWCDSSIYQILKNQTYIGQWHTYYTKIPVSVPPIVDVAIFAAAQEKLAKGRAVHRRTSDRRYLLRRRLRCRECNYAMIGCHRHDRMYYRCTAANNGQRCALPHIPARVLELLVWQWIRQHVLIEAHLHDLVDQHAAVAGTNHAQAEADRTFYVQQQADLERRMLDLADLYSAGVYTLDEIRQKKGDLSRAHDSIVRELHTLSEQLDSAALLRTNVDQLIGIINEINEQRDEPSSFDIQRTVLEILDTRIEVFSHDGSIAATMTCRLTGDIITVPIVWQRRKV